MVEVEEIELDLGLSIGGTFRKPAEKTKPELRSDGFVSDPDPPPSDGIGTGMQQRVGDDPSQAKREIQALRRMEAKKKREQKRSTSRDRVGDSEPECQRVFKREKMDFVDGVSSAAMTVSWTAPFCGQQPHLYGTVQYVPFNNGTVPLNNAFTLPCWVANEKNVRGIDGVNVNGGDGKPKSNGSSRCSSSAVSDYQSSSREDGGSIDSHSHSANSFAEPAQLNSSKEINIRSQPEESDSSHPRRSKHGNNSNVQDRKHNVKETQTHEPNIMMQPNPMKIKEEEAATNGKALPMPSIDHKPLPNENSSSSTGPLKETTKVEMETPPSKPLTQTSSFPQMPYVSTKGNGPNGKTVNGFLYRYTKSEVSIVCVCHGSTFSPAEFVQHAGGTDISHPLRHITVIPFAFG